VTDKNIRLHLDGEERGKRKKEGGRHFSGSLNSLKKGKKGRAKFPTVGGKKTTCVAAFGSRKPGRVSGASGEGREEKRKGGAVSDWRSQEGRRRRGKTQGTS